MIKLFHVSDIHFGVTDPDAHAWFVRCVAEERPDAIALTGDITQRSTHAEYAAATRWIGEIAAPVKVEIGNHDMPYYHPLERAFAPYRRYRKLKAAVERPIDLPGVALVSLRTTSRAQWRFNWSRGIVRPAALAETLATIAALPKDGRMILVTAHHPLVESNTKGQALTRHGEKALCALAQAGVTAILTGHVHDAFDLMHPTRFGPIRMIGAGTLSQRVRSTPPSFNELTIDAGKITVCARNIGELDTAAMQIEDVPPDAQPPGPDDPIARSQPVETEGLG